MIMFFFRPVGGGILSIGKDVSFNRSVNVVARESIKIGNGCSFGPNVCIYDNDHYFDKNGFLKGKFRTSPIEIGNNCWIGSNVTILRGSKIGEGSIIGAGAVIHGDIPPFSIVRSCIALSVEELK